MIGPRMAQRRHLDQKLRLNLLRAVDAIESQRSLLKGRFDVSEMAIATFLQARAYGKPLVLLPITLAARFQQSALLCRANSRIKGPEDLCGCRVGVRACSQTTGMWLRGILADEYGVQPDQVRWVTFEDAHVREYRDPPWAERASPGADLAAMLRAGELDAIIVGNEVPSGADIRPVFPDVDGSARRFWQAHRFVPVNHLVTVRREHADAHPDLVRELMRLFRESKDAAGPRREPDPYLFGREALAPAVTLALRYSQQQGLLPRELSLAEVWEGTPAL
ncbi:MAG: ABC transporter substrate-binding protein [Acetobacteraceae bacterium]|nr:ABC transporter substrate-binding protein [Acetobacteraceae bacterium]